MRVNPFDSPPQPPARRVDVRKILNRHRPFFIAAAFALGGLIAIEAWGVTQFFPLRPAGAQWALAVFAVVFTIGASLIGLLAPARLVTPEDFPRPVGAFAQAAGYGILFTVLTFTADFFILLALGGFRLDAAVMLLKDLYFFALVTVLMFHGLTYYVRQMHWLYEEFGGADSPLKPIAASGGLAVLMVVVALALLPLDLQTITNAPEPQRAVVGLFIYGRDLYLLTLALGAYLWHLRWIADH